MRLPMMVLSSDKQGRSSTDVMDWPAPDNESRRGDNDGSGGDKVPPNYRLRRKVVGGIAVGGLFLGTVGYVGYRIKSAFDESKRNAIEAATNNLDEGLYRGRLADHKGISIDVFENGTRLNIGCENVPNLVTADPHPYLAYTLTEGSTPNAVAHMNDATIVDAAERKRNFGASFSFNIGTEEGFKSFWIVAREMSSAKCSTMSPKSLQLLS